MQGDSQEVEPVEEAVFSAISRLLLHLPEQDNISIFTSLISWASPPPATPTETPTAPARLISLYRFVSDECGFYALPSCGIQEWSSSLCYLVSVSIFNKLYLKVMKCFSWQHFLC